MNEELLKRFEDMKIANQGVVAALQRQINGEPGHLEALMLFEKNTDIDDAESVEPKSEEENDATMQAHIAASPFAVDVASAKAKLFEVMKE